MKFPEIILTHLEGQSLVPQNIGMSGADVWCSDQMVLKVEDPDQESECNLAMLRFLSGKLPVPEVIAETIWEDKRYLLMRRLPGQMACSECYLKDPNKLVKLLAQGLQTLWSIDPEGCPSDQRLPQKLKLARRQVALERYDLSNVDADTFGPNGFASPEALLIWLEENPPEEDPVITHGDYCLPNVFFQGDRLSGFLDLGRCGIADRYADIALCWRSLRDNFNGSYGYHDPSFDPDILFSELGITPDWDKIRYYLLMDELF